MGTKSNRSSGTQHNPRGVTQGNTLVDPNTGLPIDVIEDTEGTRRLAVDANISANFGDINVDLDYEDDSVSIGDPNSNTTLKIESDGSINANTEIDAADGDNIAIKSSAGNELDIDVDGAITTKIKGANTPTIVNIQTVLANTEYSYTFPNNTKRYRINTRNNAILQFAFISGQTNTQYIKINPGSYYEESGLDILTVTVYFRSNKAGEIVEILSWV